MRFVEINQACEDNKNRRRKRKCFCRQCYRFHYSILSHFRKTKTINSRILSGLIYPIRLNPKTMTNKNIILLIFSLVLGQISYQAISRSTRGETIPAYSQPMSKLAKQVIDNVRNETIERAEQMMKEKPITVTASSCKRSAGAKNDFY